MGSSSAHRGNLLWTGAAALVACCLAYLVGTGSVAGTTALLFAFVVLGFAVWLTLHNFGLRTGNIGAWRSPVSPWRKGSAVLRNALQNLDEAFITLPGGAVYAPALVEVRLSPADIRLLAAQMDLSAANVFALRAYETAIATYEAKTMAGCRIEVRVISDPEVQAGTYVITRGEQPDQPPSHAKPADQVRQNPLLRLRTADDVAQTRSSGACAGRSHIVEFPLPDEPTISRVHARFTCDGGLWQITNLGRNGMSVNGRLLDREDQRTIRHGDVIRWGSRPDCPVSIVEVLP